jgi:membrane protease subunit HflC
MKPIAIIIALVLAVLLSSSVFVVNEREVAVLLQFGAVKRSDFAPGIHFKVPLVQTVRKYDRRILTLSTDPERFLTSENKYLLVDFFVKWRIKNVARFYTASSGDELTASQRLSPIVRQALAKEINARKLQEVVSVERGNVMQQLQATANTGAAELGIEIVDVRVKRIDLPEEVRGSVFDRMRSQRKQVANQLRSEGTELAETIRAGADRQRRVILAEAQRDSQMLRGEGDAQAAEIYAKAYTSDAEFYAFHRSLEAYREAFRNKDGVLVLDPKSEFFKYFGETAR